MGSMRGIRELKSFGTKGHKDRGSKEQRFKRVKVQRIKRTKVQRRKRKKTHDREIGSRRERFSEINRLAEGASVVKLMYAATEHFPKSETYGLTSQIRRACVSVPANIAEGYSYGSDGQVSRFLDIARGSLAEVEYYLILAQDLKYISEEQYEESETLRAEVGFLLYRLMQSIKK